VSLYRNPPATRYVDTGAGFVGYQVFGEGRRNIVFRSALDSNADAMWDSPAVGRYFDRLASLGRVLYYDWRGSGVSDPLPTGHGLTWDTFNDDGLSAMGAAGMDSAVFVGDREGGPSALLYAARIRRESMLSSWSTPSRGLFAPMTTQLERLPSIWRGCWLG